MTAMDVGPVVDSLVCSRQDCYVVRREVGDGLPAMISIVWRVRFVGSPLHSRALMPKRDVKKERGRKLNSVCISGG